MIRPLLALLLSCLLALPLSAAEPQQATVLRDTALLAEPYSDAKKLATLKAKQRVTIVRRKGGWYEVQRGTTHGWLRMSRVRFGSDGAAGDEGEGLAQTLSFLTTGRSGASGVTVATGIRGLGAADVANATPNHGAVAKLSRYQTTPDKARRYAVSAKLKSQPLGYLDEK